MDGLPTELLKLCHLAFMGECGDHSSENVPALGLWAAVLMPVARLWTGSNAAAREVLHTRLQEDLRAGV